MDEDMIRRGTVGDLRVVCVCPVRVGMWSCLAALLRRLLSSQQKGPFPLLVLFYSLYYVSLLSVFLIRRLFNSRHSNLSFSFVVVGMLLSFEPIERSHVHGALDQ